MIEPTVREKILKPTIREVILNCVSCKKEDKYFMTNQEIFTKTSTLAHCDNCQKTTRRSQSSE